MNRNMKRLLGYILTPIHISAFALVLIIFHPIQWLAYNLGGYTWHKPVVDVMNYLLIQTCWILGSRVTFDLNQELPEGRPVIIVSNHQSHFDIPPFFWYLRKHHVKFISKIELGKGIPSISYNLRKGGNVLIDRKDPKQSLAAIRDFAKYIEENKYSAVIFPEGTRSRNGVPKKFSPNGLKMLLKYSPSAIVLPVTINNSWKMLENGFYPMPFGTHLTWKVHPYLEPAGRNTEELLREIEGLIKKDVETEKIMVT